MGQRLVDLGVKRIALFSVGHQAEAAERRLQRLGDLLETAGELAVFPSLVDRVKRREQPGQRAGHCLLANRGPVPVDALAVVGVLGLQPLQVGRPLGQARLDVAGLRPVLLLCPILLCPILLCLLLLGPLFLGRCRGLAHLLCVPFVLRALRRRLGGLGALGAGRARSPAGTSGAGRLRGRVLPSDLAADRVDAPVVVDDWAGARLLRFRCWHQAAPPSLASSSTISASTTSSSAVPVLSSAESVGELACCAWACW